MLHREVVKQGKELQKFNNLKQQKLCKGNQEGSEKNDKSKEVQIPQSTKLEQNQRVISGLDITMDLLILSMAYVINCTDQEKQKKWKNLP